VLDVPAQTQALQTSVPSSGAPSAGSLNELAVSFIMETIQTVKSPPFKAVQVTDKDDLAAKQKRLEQHIAESKLLMAQLSSARTKEEKENILGVLRERRRLMEEDMKADSAKSSAPPVTSSVQTWQRQRSRWPEPPPTPTVLVISDDEDDEA